MRSHQSYQTFSVERCALGVNSTFSIFCVDSVISVKLVECTAVTQFRNPINGLSCPFSASKVPRTQTCPERNAHKMRTSHTPELSLMTLLICT